jgi:CubicO group peptidase (beta-lactamase class C family)
MLDFIKPLLNQAVADGVAPSAAVCVGVRDKVLAVYTAGDAARETLFDMASITKILSTNAVALRALELGEITLWDTVSRFIPNAPEDKAEIPLIRLLTHTSGISPHFRLDAVCDDPKQALDAILNHPLEVEPGTVAYTCMGFILLGKILEGIFGAPLDKLASEFVFKPLGMDNTGYNPKQGPFAPTEIDPATGKALSGVVHDENARFLGGVSGNAGVFSNIDDMSRYASSLAADDGRLFAPGTLHIATRNYSKGQGVHRGLGFHLGGVPESYMGDYLTDTAFGHTGFTGTSLVIDPISGRFTVLLTNRVNPTRENIKIQRFRRVLHNRIFAELSRDKL